MSISDTAHCDISEIDSIVTYLKNALFVLEKSKSKTKKHFTGHKPINARFVS